MACKHGTLIGEHCTVCRPPIATQPEDDLAHALAGPAAHSYHAVSTGWLCPKCKSTFAPHVTECRHCAATTEPI